MTDWLSVCREGVAALRLEDGGQREGRPYLSLDLDPGLSLLDPEPQLAAFAARNLYRRIAASDDDSEVGRLGVSLAAALFARDFTPCLERRFRRALATALAIELGDHCPAGALCRLAGHWAPRDLVEAVRPRPSLAWINAAAPRRASPGDRATG